MSNKNPATRIPGKLQITNPRFSTKFYVKLCDYFITRCMGQASGPQIDSPHPN